jgi:hypothetical protein
LEVAKDLVEAPTLIFKINDGLAEVVHLLLLRAVLALLVLELLLEEGVLGQGFMELHLQPQWCDPFSPPREWPVAS